MTERESLSPWTGSVLCTVPWENPSGLHPMLHERQVPSIWGDMRCYSLSILLFLDCLFEAVTLLSHLLLGLSYWDPERYLHQLALTSPPTPVQNRQYLLLQGQRNRDLLNYFLEVRIGKKEGNIITRILNSTEKLMHKYQHIWYTREFYPFFFSVQH